MTNTDDAQEALRALRAAADVAEAEASALVHQAAAKAGGRLARWNSRFKTDESIAAKLERFRLPQSPCYRLDRFNDALRYTIVLDDPVYWRGCLTIVDALGADDFQVTTRTLGWRRGYAGLNLTVEDAGGRLFEVQVHTPASLAAAESGHALYEQWRSMDRHTPAARALRRAIDAAAAQVPLPPGVTRL